MPIEAVLGVLVNEIAVHAEEGPYLLILDDLHLITAEPIARALSFFLDHLPSAFHLVIITRVDPLLPLPRFRARQQMTEIRTEDLRFSSQEATAFLNQSMKLNLAEVDVTALEARTEGWIAGLQMAALAMPEHDIAGFIQAFAGSHRYVLDYLLEEVLNREPEPIQSFLTQTSILGRLCGPLCDAVTGRQDGQSLVERLESANLFLTPLDYDRRWYRYHPLFAELLSRQLNQSRPDLVPVLHQRACKWYEQQGSLDEAVAHALAARDFERAAGLIEKAAFDVLGRSEIGTLMGWLAALPEAVIRPRPWLCVFQAWILIMSGQGEVIERRLQEAESAVQTTSLPAREADRLQAYIAAIRAQVTFIQGAAPRTIEYARFALSKLTSADETLRATTITILGAAQSFNGDFDAAIQSFERAKKLSLAGGNHFNAMLALSALAQLAVVRGRLREAHRIYREGLSLVEKPGNPASPGVGYAYVGLAEVLREWNELESAADYAERGVALCKLIGQAEILMPAYITLARVQCARGDPQAALATLQEASQVASELSAWSLESVYVHLARLWLLKGDLAPAVQWMQQSGLGPDAPILFNREAALLTAVRVLLAQSRSAEADRLLKRLAEAAENTGRWGSLVEILLLQGLSTWNQGEKGRALVPLERALGLAEPEGYLRIFLDEGESMHTMLADYHKHSSKSTPYLEKLLAVFSGGGPTGVAHPQSTLVEPLSERELEVLRLLAAGRSNPEIARDLYISLNTVKAHVKSIFAKLEAHNRTGAANRARELQLI